MIAAGFDNGDVNMFDLRNMKLQWSTNVGNGVCSLQYDRMGNYIYNRSHSSNSTVIVNLETKNNWEPRGMDLETGG